MTYAYKRLCRHIPNALTLLRIASAPLLWHALALNAPIPAFWLITFAAISDFGDGYIARRFVFSSSIGSFLDPLADKIFVLMAFAALWYQGVCPWWVVGAIGLRDLLVTFLRSFLMARGVVLHTTFFAKSKTAFQFMALYFFTFSMTRASNASWWISVVTVLLTIASSATYWRFLWRYLRLNGTLLGFLVLLIVGSCDAITISPRQVVRYGGLAAALAGGVYGFYQHRQAKRVSGARKKRNVAGAIAAAGVAAFLASWVSRSRALFPPAAQTFSPRLDLEIKDCQALAERGVLGKINDGEFILPRNYFLHQQTERDGWCVFHSAIFTEKMLSDAAFNKAFLNNELPEVFVATKEEMDDFKRRLFSFVATNCRTFFDQHLQEAFNGKTLKDLQEGLDVFCVSLDPEVNSTLSLVFRNGPAQLLTGALGKEHNLLTGNEQCECNVDSFAALLNKWGDLKCGGHFNEKNDWVASTTKCLGLPIVIAARFLSDTFKGAFSAVEWNANGSMPICYGTTGPFVHFCWYEGGGYGHLKGHCEVLVPRTNVPEVLLKEEPA